MQLLIIILLALNLIGVLFLTIRSFIQPKNGSGMEQVQQILASQMGLSREIIEVKAKLDYYYAALKQESEQWQADRQAFEASIQAKPKRKQKSKSKQEENLLLNDRYKEIFELQKQGLNAEEIAKKLDKGCGEVTLILGLAAHK